MLDSVHGTVLEAGADSVVIEVGGLALRLKVPPGSARGASVGSTARFFCHLMVREEQFQLFGFANSRDREIFHVLLSVSGLGPEKARALLGVMTPSDVARAVVEEDSRRFQIVKGIGSRLAQRLALELKGKVDAFLEVTIPSRAISSRSSGQLTDLIGALTQLGFPRAPAEEAARGAIEAAPEQTMEDHLRAAIRSLQSSE